MKYKFPDLNYKEHKRCPRCEKLMIKREMSTELDDRREWDYWCNCGNWEYGGILKGIPETTWVKNEWKRVNNIQRLTESKRGGVNDM